MNKYASFENFNSDAINPSIPSKVNTLLKQRKTAYMIVWFLAVFIFGLIVSLYIQVRANRTLLLTITALRVDNDGLIMKNNEMDSTGNMMSKQIHNLEETIAFLKNEINAIKKPLNQLPIIDIQGNVPTDIIAFSDFVIIESFFDSTIKLTLLYKASHHGDSSSLFHKQIDNYSNLLFVAVLGNDEKIGGYTSMGFTFDKPDSSSKNDPKAFLFSLTNQKKYFIQNPTNAIVLDKGLLFTFNLDLMIYDNCLSNMKHYSAFPKSFNTKSNSAKTLEYTGGLGNFRIKNLEVFHVSFVE